MRTAVVVAAAAVATVPPSIAIGATSTPEPDPHVVAAQAALERLSVVDRAGQLVMTSFPGRRIVAPTGAQLRRLRPGGVIVFADNYRTRQQLTSLLRGVNVAGRAGSLDKPSLLVSIDQEGGVVKRIPDAPPTRSHPQLGAADNVAATRRQAGATAAQLKPLGVTMDLAPVADLDLGPRRVMRERSFGRSPALVSRHVTAFVEGLETGGIAASVKHFPGFGGASVNSDDALATITRNRAQLRADLQPFRAAITAGVDSVMISHGVYRRIDRQRPASTSPLVYRMLRRDLGYGGVVITDSLHAAGFAAAAKTNAPAGCPKVIAAGADIALLTGPVADALRCRTQLLAAVRSGKLTQARIDEAVLRILTLKSRLGLLPEVNQPA